jgi:hypothetical protein
VSMNKTAYLIMGIRMKESEFPGDRWNDEKWIPYSEGYNEDEVDFHTGEGDDHIYIGKVLERLSKYKDAGYYEMGFVDFVHEQLEVGSALIRLFGKTTMPNLMLVELWG